MVSYYNVVMLLAVCTLLDSVSADIDHHSSSVDRTTVDHSSTADRTNVDPTKYHCTQESPINDNAWTAAGSGENKTPAIAITHIFCGQINSDGEAEGFHARPGDKDPPSAKTAEISYNYYLITCAKEVSVYDYNKDKFIPRDIPSNKYCFFPSDWSIEGTVNHINEVFKKCKTKITSDNKICARDKFDTILYLSPATTPAGYDVVSAFPAPQYKYSCNNNCVLKDDKTEL